jgi:hypothetical protein
MGLTPEDGKYKVQTAAKEAEQQAAQDKGENTPEAKVAKRLASLITALNLIEDANARMAALSNCTATLRASVTV